MLKLWVVFSETAKAVVVMGGALPDLDHLSCAYPEGEHTASKLCVKSSHRRRVSDRHLGERGESLGLKMAK